jgi:hypothetical protein
MFSSNTPSAAKRELFIKSIGTTMGNRNYYGGACIVQLLPVMMTRIVPTIALYIENSTPIDKIHKKTLFSMLHP